MEKEIWKDIPGLEYNYQASSHGRIRTINTKRILSQRMGYGGYLRVKIFKENGRDYTDKRVHRLIGETFVKKIDGKNVLNHIDGVKTNNHVTNFEWVTTSENIKHAFRTGLVDKKGEAHHNAKLTDKDILNIRKLYSTGTTQAQLHRMYSLNRTTIHEVVRNKTWTHI